MERRGRSAVRLHDVRDRVVHPESAAESDDRPQPAGLFSERHRTVQLYRDRSGERGWLRGQLHVCARRRCLGLVYVAVEHDGVRGRHTFHVQATTSDGRTSAIVASTWSYDQTAPTASMSAPTAPFSLTSPITVGWTARTVPAPASPTSTRGTGRPDTPAHSAQRSIRRPGSTTRGDVGHVELEAG